MAEIHPFRGWRYDMAQVGDLADVTAPPYDVINSAEQDELYKKHPCNVVRLILNREEPGDADPDVRYSRACDFFRRWKQEGVLIQEGEDALYVYHQEFDWEGTHYVRKGFLGRIRLEEFGQGSVYPHEQTMPGPKADRLALMTACKANLSAVFGLYPDEDNAAQAALEQAIVGMTPLEATDELGVIHRMWPVTDHAVLGKVREVLADKPIFIADGHHRYETAVNYRNQVRDASNIDDSHAANFAVMMFVGMDDPGLAILPTHRLIGGLPELPIAELKEALSANFDFEDMGDGADGAKQAWDNMQMDGGQTLFGLGTASDGNWVLARLTDATSMSDLAPDQSDDWRGLGVSILHRMILDHLIGGKYSGWKISWKYVHLMDEVLASQAAKTSQLACLVAPAGMDHIQQIAAKFEKMPPKSTFFYPKLLSGLVFNPLE